MATKLKELTITSTDLVDQGANPEAHVCLFKTADVDLGVTQGILKGDLEDFSVEKREYVEKMARLEGEVAILKQSLLRKDMETLAKRFEVIGKNAEDLASVLLRMKEAGDDVYGIYLKSLEEQVDLLEKRGLFQEFGTSIGGETLETGGRLEQRALEIEKREGISEAKAMMRAFEENPELALAYEKEFLGKRG